MFDTEDRRIDERGGSLLSLGRAVHEERLRQQGGETPHMPTHPDALARHQTARRRREAVARPAGGESIRDGGVHERPASAVAPKTPSKFAAESAEKQTVLSRLWPSRRENLTTAIKGDDDLSAASAGSPVASVPRMPMSDTVMVMDRVDEEDWRPLIDPAKVVGGIVNSKGLIVATTLLGALLAGGMAFMTPKKYEAYAEVLVHPRDLKLFDRELTDEAGLPSDATLAIIENQVRVLTSSTVLNRVVNKLGLESDPEFNGSGGLDMNPLNIVRSLLTRSDGTSDPARLRGLTVQTLAENINVERTGKTFTILVGAIAQSPKRAAQIANTMVAEFLDTANKRQADTAGKATDELTGKLDEMRRNVEAAERKVEKFKAENDIIDAQGRLITDDEIVKLNDQLSTAKARTLELNARAQSARNISTDDVLSGASPEAAASGVLTELRTQYATAKQEAERLSVRLGPRHPQYQAAQAQLDGAREQIGVELRRINAQVQTELRRAVQLEQELASRLAQLKVRQGDLSSEMVTLRELQREASTQRSVYEAFLLRARETGEQKDISTVNISVISDAQPPLEASGASRAVITGAGAFLGLLAGIGLGGARGAFESLSATPGARRRRTAAVRVPVRPEGDEHKSPEPVSKPQVKAAVAIAEPAANTVKSAEGPKEPPAASETAAKDNSMNAPYFPPGYYPPQGPAGSHPAAPQQAYMQPPQPYPGAPQGFPQQPIHTPMGYAQPQPDYPTAAYPQVLPQQPGWPQQPSAWPQPPQAHYPQPPMPAQAMPTPPAAYGVYPAPAYPSPYPPPPAYMPAAGYGAQPVAPAPQPAGTSAEVHAMGGSLSEIRESIREFRDAVRELSEGRSRRRYY